MRGQSSLGAKIECYTQRAYYLSCLKRPYQGSPFTLVAPVRSYRPGAIRRWRGAGERHSISSVRSGDLLADNLLARLFSYAPRVGRQTLEDYCTEALAWCLRKSPPLLKDFLNLTGVPLLRDW